MAELRGLDTSFLADIELNESTVKAIRFNDSELYMVKMAKYKGLNFSSYVKGLIIDDVKKICNPLINNNVSKETLKDIVREVLREESYIDHKEPVREIEEDITEDIENQAINALTAMGIRKR